MKSYINGELRNEVAQTIFEIKSCVTGQQIENIIVDAVETGIGYWATLKDDTEEFTKLYDEGLCTSEAITEIILNNGEVELSDANEEVECKYKLSLNRLLKGIELNAKHRPFDSNLDNMDSTTVDCIIQYALFDEVVFA